MYIENAYHGKSPKWLYLIYSLGFLGFMGLNFLVLLFFDYQTLMQNQIEKKGELRYFAEDLMSGFVLFLVALLVWVRYVHRQPLRAFHTSRPRVDWKRFFFAFTLWGGILVLTTFIDYWMNPQDYVWNFQADKFLILLLLSVLLIPIQAGFEEYFFRGYLMQGIGIAVKNRWIPLLVTSILFGLMHSANPEIEKLGYGFIFYYIGIGLFLGMITLFDEGLELALGFHIANNLITGLLVTTNWGVFRLPALFVNTADPTDGAYYQLLFLGVFILLCFYMFSKKYGWNLKDWKQKLFGKVMSEKEFFNKITPETHAQSEREIMK
ncbi:CPBP family intramembrane glutamic endopeptidase [Capnocytophaga canis]|uniref:CPBP family intramembrane glutamic endopeptidase n=1 Tax=Capnocytophaga canis TaxID=1848903 RepID=UPI00370DDFF2